MAMDAQYVYGIMQLKVGNMIMMYEYAIKEDHKKISKEVNKLIVGVKTGGSRVGGPELCV